MRRGYISPLICKFIPLSTLLSLLPTNIVCHRIIGIAQCDDYSCGVVFLCFGFGREFVGDLLDAGVEGFALGQVLGFGA